MTGLRSASALLLVSCLLICAVADDAVAVQTDALAVPTTGSNLVDVDKLPLHTQGRFIVNRLNERVKWACVNLYGADSETYVAGGMEVVPIEQLAKRIVDLGFNCVRFPYSLEAFNTNPPVKQEFVKANPKMAGKNFLDVYDATVEALTDAGLMLILDNHVSNAGWCCHMDQREGLWYSPEYPQAAWINTLVNVTARYMHNPLVVGMGLRNEVHDWINVKLSWGDGNPETDWHMAATKAANAVLAVNPNVVIPIMALCSGMCLIPAKTHPIQLDVPNRVIYETHNYLEYVFVNLIPEDLVSWETVHMIVNVFTVAAVLQFSLLLWRWWDLGRPIPKVMQVISSIGYWFCGVAVVGFIAIGAAFKVVSNFCYWWASNGVLPWLKYPSFLLCLGIVLVLAGMYGKRALRKVQGLSDDDSSEPMSYLRVWADPEDTTPDKKDAVKQPLAGDVEMDLVEKGVNVLSPALESKSQAWTRTLHGMTGCCLAVSALLKAHDALTYLASYDFARDFLDDKWGFVTEEGQPYTAPIWVGEFSYDNDGPAWQHIVRYLSERDMDFGFWAINGKKYGTGFMDPHTGHYNYYSYCDNDHGCDMYEHGWDFAHGRCDENAMEGTNCAPELSQGDKAVCSYQVPTQGQTCNAYCASKGRTCVRASSLSGPDTCSMTDERPPEEVPAGEGCDMALPEQVCTCSMQLWRWDNETFGLLEPDYNTVQKAWRIRDLHALAQSPSTWIPRDIACAGDYRDNKGC
eukprot:TRINITY_DN3292_c0_g2_i1.p1 TRINITY_DN3292_c0_g2~~TRINITY_DN3292_c0_g2_i1.p1  ORF type:complete len:768 (+),score=130.21 TRINITY_DN3292_c0_g2_i1:70-2304(+)